MDFILSQNNLWILLIALVSGALLVWPGLNKGKSGKKIALTQAVDKVNRENGLFIDIRPADQFKGGAIPQARNIPLDTIEHHIGSLPKDKPLTIVDAHGRDGHKALNQLKKHGFDQVVCLEGGLQSWVEGGMPLKKS